MDRNPRETEELNVKPQIHNKFEDSVYRPGKYLNFRNEHETMKDTKCEANNSSLSRILNMRKSNIEAKLNVPLQGGNTYFSEASFINKHSGESNV